MEQLTPEAMQPVEILLQMILQRHLLNSYCLTVISEFKLNIQIPISFTYIFYNDSSTILTDQILETSEMGCSDYVIMMKNFQIFMETFDKVNHLGNTRRSDRKILLLPTDDNETGDMLNLLSMKEANFVANLLLIVPFVTSPDGCKLYDLVTHKFVGPDDEIHQPLYLDKWDSCKRTFEKNVDLFPHDITDLQGKTIRVGCFTYKPYVLLDLPMAPNGRDGTEMRIVETFCKWVNCTLEVVNAGKEQWGEMYENMTGIGVIGSVGEDRADMGISALYSWYEIYVYLDFSAASIRTAITCIAPAPRLLVSWEMPLLPFSWNIWICVVITFIFSSFALIIAQGWSTNKAFLITFATFISQSQDESHFTWRIRSIVGWLLLSGLVLCNAYGAGLASTYTVPKLEKSIDTIQDIVDSKMEWGATHDAWIFSLTLSQEPVIKQLVSQFRIYSAEELKSRSFMRNMAFSIERLPAGYFAIGEYITKEAVLDLMLMQEKFYYEQNVVMLRKSSPYTAKVSDLIGRLHETGLLLAWETQIALKYMDYKVQVEVKLSRSKKDVQIVPLSFRHIIGVFYIYLVGIGLSFVLFILEICYKRESSNTTNFTSRASIFDFN